MGTRRTPQDCAARAESDRRRLQECRLNVGNNADWREPRQRHCWVRRPSSAGDVSEPGLVLAWHPGKNPADEWIARVVIVGEGLAAPGARPPCFRDPAGDQSDDACVDAGSPRPEAEE
ncbi:hypothetical protein [Leekyejoonella antrihumi]|uniref:Uncharacterized protein n=1 Tax=Leekyejoonella antrihumi TaxID=1660198 RepID=A0A563DPX6_9MICO|nr:hypothetical protein [Leekyejoonella antrihumi]TWP32011.1 hypothetical protein FGL98_24830 [Leekyejoonella antrihumi]